MLLKLLITVFLFSPVHSFNYNKCWVLPPLQFKEDYERFDFFVKALLYDHQNGTVLGASSCLCGYFELTKDWSIVESECEILLTEKLYARKERGEICNYSKDKEDSCKFYDVYLYNEHWLFYYSCENYADEIKPNGHSIILASQQSVTIEETKKMIQVVIEILRVTDLVKPTDFQLVLDEYVDCSHGAQYKRKMERRERFKDQKKFKDAIDRNYIYEGIGFLLVVISLCFLCCLYQAFKMD